MRAHRFKGNVRTIARIAARPDVGNRVGGHVPLG
ncbi:hypothetical protein KE639_00180 [Streptomyces sp. V17-9]|nr:hypothetical protein KE639_00180 [Streptomyces sp. V17-9]